jgi:hypothetical protein
MKIEEMNIAELWQYVDSSDALSDWNIKSVDEMLELVSESAVHGLLLNAAVYARWKSTDVKDRPHHASSLGREIIREGYVSARALQNGKRLAVDHGDTLKNGAEYISIPAISLEKYGPIIIHNPPMPEVKELTYEDRGLIDDWDDQLFSLVPKFEGADEVIAAVVKEVADRGLATAMAQSFNGLVDEALKFVDRVECSEDGLKLYVRNGEVFGSSLPSDAQTYAVTRATQFNLLSIESQVRPKSSGMRL